MSPIVLIEGQTVAIAKYPDNDGWGTVLLDSDGACAGASPCDGAMTEAEARQWALDNVTAPQSRGRPWRLEPAEIPVMNWDDL